MAREEIRDGKTSCITDFSSLGFKLWKNRIHQLKAVKDEDPFGATGRKSLHSLKLSRSDVVLFTMIIIAEIVVIIKTYLQHGLTSFLAFVPL